MWAWTHDRAVSFPYQIAVSPKFKRMKRRPMVKWGNSTTTNWNDFFSDRRKRGGGLSPVSRKNRETTWETTIPKFAHCALPTLRKHFFFETEKTKKVVSWKNRRKKNIRKEYSFLFLGRRETTPLFSFVSRVVSRLVSRYRETSPFFLFCSSSFLVLILLQKKSYTPFFARNLPPVSTKKELHSLFCPKSPPGLYKLRATPLFRPSNIPLVVANTHTFNLPPVITKKEQRNPPSP